MIVIDLPDDRRQMLGSRAASGNGTGPVAESFLFSGV